MRRFLLRSLVVAAGLALTACANNNPPTPTLPPLTFADKPPFVLNVARIEIVSQFSAPTAAPHIEYELPVSPENAIRRWVQDRIQPRGTTGVLRVVIRNASATETSAPEASGGMFNNEPQDKVDMAVDVDLQLLDERQFVVADVTGQAMRGETLFTDLKLNERDKFLYEMVRQLVGTLGDQLSQRIPINFHSQMMY